MSAAALLRIRHLPGEDGLELVGGHTGPGHDAVALSRCWRRDDGDGIDAALAAGLQQQGYVQDDHGMAAGAGGIAEGLFGAADQRMDDRLEALQRLRILQHHRAEPCAINPAIDRHARKGGLDGRDGVSGIEPVNRRIGIMNGDPRLAEEGRGGGFAHADGAGKAKDEHVRSPGRRRRHVPTGRA